QQYRDELLPASLLFATSFCGPTRVHVSELVRLMGDELCAILAHCDGFDCSNDELEDWLLDHRQPDTFYSGIQHLRPEHGRRHRTLRDALETYIEQRQAHGGLSRDARVVHREIQDYVKTCPDLAWTREPFKPTLGAWLALYWRSLIVEGILALL